MRTFSIIVLSFFMITCKTGEVVTDEVSAPEDIPFTWDNANVYFLLTDRFFNGNPNNDFDHSIREAKPAPLRGYMGGDFAGIIQKIEEGYFSELGIHAIWISPVVEQIDGSVDEGTGISFAFHGYWTKDWTALNPMFGNEEELRMLVKTAHEHNIRVLLDVVINHTGPVTEVDPKWPDDWVRTEPTCVYKDAASTINCTLVDNLPDILTENKDQAVSLPPHIIEKWEAEGRLEQEMAELDMFFEETGFPRTPYHHIIKWLVDLIIDYGFDGFRVDTVKHTESYVWLDLWKVAQEAWELWKQQHPEEAIDDAPFYIVGEVYNYYITNGREFDYGDRKVDFYKDGFHSLINFDFKTDAKLTYDTIFTKYSDQLHTALEGHSVLNYISSHDDGGPFDLHRDKAISAATKLLLTPGGVQIYYGDESARRLDIEAATGDAKLRSFMNWQELTDNVKRGDVLVQDVLLHYQRLGKFRHAHPAVGAGIHTTISMDPYICKREYTFEGGEDRVLIALEMPSGNKTIPMSDTFVDGTMLIDYYSGQQVVVSDGKVTVDSPYDIVLLGK